MISRFAGNTPGNSVGCTKGVGGALRAPRAAFAVWCVSAAAMLSSNV